VAAAYAQKYTGPPPPQADLPYIQHATNLIATEPAEAKELKPGTDTVYTVDGANSPAKTPLALPIFVIEADRVDPASLRMYRMAAKESRRELTASSKKTAEPIHVQVTKLSGDNRGGRSQIAKINLPPFPFNRIPPQTVIPAPQIPAPAC
jgi:hypothetical protein